jgi:hypothetical protein
VDVIVEKTEGLPLFPALAPEEAVAAPPPTVMG